MNLEPLRRLQSKLAVATLAAAALVLSSCGGGGATSSPNNVGSLQLLPAAASIYAGVPYTVNIVGGRKPYLITSNEPTLIELNFTTDSNQFTFVARNPGVVDVGLDPDEVPRRSVTIEVRDSNGTSISNTYSVLQNFFTGYGQFYNSTCATAGTGAPPQACSGADSIVTLVPVSNGALYGNREFQLDRVRGDYSFVVENPAVTPQLVNQLRVRTDQLGRAFVRIRVNVNAPTQLATYKVTDILTGVTTDVVFTIVQQPSLDVITLLPEEVTFTGALSNSCGIGTADVTIFGGTPPYSINASAGIAVSPTTVDAAGSRFTVSVGVGTPPCPSNTSVTVTDSRGAVTVLPVDIVVGSAAPPPLSVAPASIANLDCGTTIALTVIGGAGTRSVTSQHPRITATLSGNTLAVRRLAADPTPPYATSGSVTVTDGTTIVTVPIAVTPATCL